MAHFHVFSAESLLRSMELKGKDSNTVKHLFQTLQNLGKREAEYRQQQADL